MTKKKAPILDSDAIFWIAWAVVMVAILFAPVGK